MEWIDEMFVNMEKDKTAASVKRSANGPKVDRTEYPKKRIPGALNGWNALVSSITSDLNDFNNRSERAGHTPVVLSRKNFRCEVHLSGMTGKTLVLTLDNSDCLQVVTHPDFPEQRLTITLELDKEGQRSFWVLGQATKERAQLSDQQLSEYLLKPILSCASINSPL
jgi:hypothetical protein